MPTYEYQCPDCNHVFEEFQSITAKPRRDCPVCGGKKVKRLIGAGSGLIFKGSGFYQTDYRSESYKKAASAESSSESKAGKAVSESKSGKSGTSQAKDPA
ncbi:MAG: Zinc ribbon domain protein [Planctomycetes bacterium ADurb.Bin412]|nr:MAG: Zinc ribbon domain protein [Planctomycetes bacterium ADurb.Bin412]